MPTTLEVLVSALEHVFPPTEDRLASPGQARARGKGKGQGQGQGQSQGHGHGQG